MINEGKVSADILHSAELNTNDESVDNVDSTSDHLQVTVTLEGEVLRPAGLGKSSYLEETGITSISISNKFTESYLVIK